MRGANGEATQVERLHVELKYVDVFARNIIDSSKMMHSAIDSLRIWAVSFYKAIGISPSYESEALYAFMSVICTRDASMTTSRKLLPPCNDKPAA